MSLISSIGQIAGSVMLASAYVKMMREVAAYSKRDAMQNGWLLSTQPNSVVRSYKKLPNIKNTLLQYKTGWALFVGSLVASFLF